VPAAKASSGKAKPSQQQQQQPPPPNPHQPPPAELVERLKSEHRRSRLLEFYERVLSRELLLKLNVRSAAELPRVDRVTLAVQARAVAGAPRVEKWELLLQALALELISGEPAAFAVPKAKYYAKRNTVTGVRVTLRGRAAHDALDKIAYLLLPSQNAFEGLLVRQLDAAGGLHFRVSTMVNLPDFEDMYETFENVGALDVDVALRGARRRRRERSQVLLTGLQLPVLVRKHQVE
jgi:ribosomal protein L5